MLPDPAPPAPTAAWAARAREDAATAVWRLLRSRRIRANRQTLLEALEAAPTLDVLAEQVRASGCAARVVSVGARELALLELPTLIALQGGAVALAIRVSRSTVTIEKPDGGHERLARERWGERAAGQALDLSGALPSGGGLWSRMVSALGRAPGSIASLVLATGLLQALSVCLPLVSRVAVDKALPNGAPDMLALVAACMLAGAGLQSAIGWFRERVLQFLQSRLVGAGNRSLLDHVVNLPFADLQRRSVGDWMQVVSAGEQIARLLVDVGLVQLLDASFLLASVVTLFVLLPAAGLASVAAQCLVLAVAILAGRRQANLQDEELVAHGRQSGRLVELITGAATIKASGAIGHGVERWSTELTAERKLNLRRQQLGTLVEVASDVARHGVFVLLLVWGGEMALRHELSVGTLLAALQLSQSFSDGAARVTDGIVKLVVSRSLSTLVGEVARSPALVAPPAARRRPPPSGDAVVLHDVWFRHGPDLPWILQGCSMRVGAGESLRLVGRSGTGKTTILRLMAGLYTPARGSVLIHGVDATAGRHMVGYLPQTTYLFQGSVMDNLRILSGGAPPARLLQAAMATGLHDFVHPLPMQYETLLPPGGYNLSGGQRQLIVLTACVASDRPILLLDEAMSNIDPLTRARLRSSNVFSNRTLVSVIHEVE